MHIQFGQILSQLSLKILSGNEIPTSVKGHNSDTNVRKMMCNDPNQDLVNINVYTKFGKILSLYFQDIERKPNYDGWNVCLFLLLYVPCQQLWSLRDGQFT